MAVKQICRKCGGAYPFGTYHFERGMCKRCVAKDEAEHLEEQRKNEMAEGMVK